VNDLELYDECIKYLSNLEVPEGYEVENIYVEEAESITKAYNEAMKTSDAKYKVYLHQDVFIRNSSFIKDVIDIFESNHKIGLMGVIGVKAIPTNGLCGESKNKFGKVYDSHSGQMKLLSFNDAHNAYESVQAIDGLIMITQYDIPWNEETFDGWDFYEIAQSVEFKKAGYEVVVPRQDEPWAIHDCGILNVRSEYDDYRKKFLQEYSKDIYPLVSILIPTYNRPGYFGLALESALNQTYKNIEIIIGDDSTNNETEELVKKSYLNRYTNIKYYHNEKNIGQFDNDLKLYDMATGEFINFLMDDDLFEVNKIQKMMEYFIQDISKDVSLVTSHRKIIDDIGNSQEIFGGTDKIFKSDAIIDGVVLGDFMLKNNINCIGEPTTVLFRKEYLKEPFGMFSGRRYGCNVDQASWLNLLSQNKAIFINDTLSYFRIHSGQQQQDFHIMIKGFTDYAHQILLCREKGFFIDNTKYLKAMENCINLCKGYILNPLKKKKISDEEYLEYEEILKYCDQLMKKHAEYKKQIEEADSTLIANLNYNSFDDGKMKGLPLVSVLIPAYNQTKYLKEALESAINQTYQNIEIIIGDDSTNDEVEEFLKPYLDSYTNITYFKNERTEMDYGYKNHVECFRRSKGEYINYLNHDDIFHPNKIENMMRYFLKNPNITLATSVRQPINEKGDKLALDGAFIKLFKTDSLISGHELSRMVVKNLTNFIGEPTTVLFKRSYIDGDKYGYFNGVRFMNISDVANWFTLLQHGDAIYISEPLSSFRIHASQNSNKTYVHIHGVIAWYHLIKHSCETGILKDLDEYKIALNKWLTTFIPIVNQFVKESDYVETQLKDNLYSCYKTAIEEIMYKYVSYNFECPICNNKVERFLPYQYKKHKADFTTKFDIIGSDADNFTCPHCYCHDRMRHILMYFNRLNIWEDHILNKNVLHIAPEVHLQQIISKFQPKEYICGDLYPTNDSIKKIDVTSIHFDENYFDFIICNHVLEHIPNDLQAMKELYRVLKKGGYAVLQTPYSPVIEESFEDRKLSTDIERLEFYGQVDHVRIYGLDFFSKLESVGFELNIIKNDELFIREECKKYGVNFREDLIFVKKS
jgi:glycosyltransferase involved in cell wall biosynthesis